ncbi:MAG: ATP-binding protein, partial [Acidimicrobiales bacterium]
MTTFVGRQSEHHEVVSLLDEHRVVTLVGPGGIGKTRLATELTAGATDRYDGGVLFTELAGTSDRDDIGNVVAAQHGFGSIDALRLSAATSPTLVVLDNCESALRQASDVAAELVDDSECITVLATSRAPLQIYGERIYVVDPLELPRDGTPTTVKNAAAVQLFLQRAEAAGATWPIDEENLMAIGELVRKLDGLPLAIELAAARSRMLAPPELVGNLDRQLDLLSNPADGATARHGSLRGAIQ